jgi:hypothetical protein
MEIHSFIRAEYAIKVVVTLHEIISIDWLVDRIIEAVKQSRRRV